MALERVADGVWLLRGDFRGAMNVYFIEDEGGVVQFDAGTKPMRKKVAATARELGGLKRVVLGHAHADHRGTAPYVDAPVFCHPDELHDAEGDKALTQAIIGARARGAIVIVVAHRPAALAGVDQVLAMVGGRMHAMGPRDEVLAKLFGPQPPAGAPGVPAAPAAAAAGGVGGLRLAAGGAA